MKTNGFNILIKRFYFLWGTKITLIEQMSTFYKGQAWTKITETRSE